MMAALIGYECSGHCKIPFVTTIDDSSLRAGAPPLHTEGPQAEIAPVWECAGSMVCC